MAGGNSTSGRGGGGDGGDDFVYDPKREASINENSDKFENESSYSSGSSQEHSSSTSGFDMSTAPGNDSNEAFADNLAKTLTRDVRVWRSIVSFMLLLTAVLVIVSTYLFLINEETNEFKDAVSSLCGALLCFCRKH